MHKLFFSENMDKLDKSDVVPLLDKQSIHLSSLTRQ